jgi:hypothetical protein
MPSSRLRKPPVPLQSLNGRSYITFTEVFVDANLDTYVNKHANLRTKALNTVGIERLSDGNYRLIIFDPDTDFLPRKIDNFSDLVPVTEIVEETR